MGDSGEENVKGGKASRRRIIIIQKPEEVGNEEGRIGSNTEELNRDQNPDQDQSQSTDRIPKNFPPIVLPYPHRRLV